MGAAAKKDKPPAKTSNEKKADQIANGVEAMRLDDTPRATSKNLDVLAEFEKKKVKNAANFVVIGMLRMRLYNILLTSRRSRRRW